MKNKRIITFCIGLWLVGVGVVLIVLSAGGREHDPKDLSYWMQAGAARNWSSEAAGGQPQAQFYCGLRSTRANRHRGREQG